MIEEKCRLGYHEKCPEIKRQKDDRISEIEKLGSQLCDCQHKEDQWQ